MRCWTHLFLFLCVQGITALTNAYDDESDAYYVKGLQFKDEGQWQKALGTWLAGKRILDSKNQSDPRLGIAFIQCATENDATSYYELASGIYLWGFSRNNLNSFHSDVYREIDRLAPLLSQDQEKEWRALYEQNSPSLCQQILNFWTEKDPTPSTGRNERLLEHWERIAFARRQFTKAGNTVYGTDDRGTMYVKYGKPDRQFQGTLGTQPSEFKRWTDVILDNSPEGLNNVNFVARPAEQQLLLEEINRYNHFPEYEIWFYHSFNTDEPVFFLFGNKEGIGRFGLRDGVEELIPARAFYAINAARGGGIIPGAVLQSVYYGQLMHLSRFFEDRYYDLERVWDILDRDGSRAFRSVGTIFRNKRQHFVVVDRNDPSRALAPAERSTFEQSVSEVEVVCVPFRFLDETGQPRIALSVFSIPQLKGRFVALSASGSILAFSVTHTLNILDSQGHEVQRIIEPLPTGYDPTSTFVLKHEPVHAGYHLYSEVFHRNTEDSDETHLASDLIGLGKKSVPTKAILSSHPDSLELSDLIVGLESPTEPEAQRLPFPLMPTGKIHPTDLLKVYLEVYRLREDDEGMSHFRINFAVARLKGKKKQEEISLSFDLDAADNISKESFQIDISKLTAGEYELLVTVSDTVSGQKKRRQAAFEILGDEGE